MKEEEKQVKGILPAVQEKEEMFVPDFGDMEEKKKRKKFQNRIIIVAAIIVITVGVGGSIFFVTNQKNSLHQQVAVSELETVAPTEIATVEPTIVVTQEPVCMPDLVGLKLKKATKLLEDLGLDVQVKKTYSAKSKNIVIRQSKMADSHIEKGKTITLVVSKGKKQTAVDRGSVSKANQEERITNNRIETPKPRVTPKPKVTSKPKKTPKAEEEEETEVIVEE